MKHYIEHDKRNCSVRTLTESDVILHYGASVVTTVWQDGSASLPHSIDIFIDDSYTLSSTINQVESKICGVKPAISYYRNTK